MASSFWKNLWQGLGKRTAWPAPPRGQRGRSIRRKPSPFSLEPLVDRSESPGPRALPLALERLECRIAPAITASISNNILVVQGTTGNDDITLRLKSGDSSKLEVLDHNSAVSGSPFNVADFTSVSVLGGDGTDKFDVSSLTANPAMATKVVTLKGEGGSDTYQFGDNWGTVVIDDTDGSLDFFPQFHGNLTLNPPSDTAGQHEVVGTNGSVTSTLDYPASGTFTTDISGPANKANLQAGLGALADLGDRIEGVQRLAQGLPIFDNQSLGQVFDIGGALRTRLVDSISGLSSSADLDEILAALNQAGGVTASGSRTSAGDVTINFVLDIQSTIPNVLLSLPGEFAPRLQTDAVRGNLSTELEWSFQVNQTSAGVFSATSSSNMQLHANLDHNGFDGRAGFLGLHFGSPSTIFLDADIPVDTSSISGKTTAQIQAIAAGSLVQTGTALAKVDLTGSTTVGGVTVTFPTLPAPHISLTGTSANSTFNLFDPVATRTFTDNFDAAGLSDFYLTNAGNVRSQLASFADFLDLFSDKALSTALPLSANSKTLGDVLDLKNQFKSHFLDLLERQALTSGTLVSTFNGGRGVRTVAGDDIKITLASGITFNVDFNTSATSSVLAAATTFGDLILKIQQKAAATSGVTAANFEVRIDPRSGGLALVDRTGGTSTTFTVQPLNGSLAAGDLDLLSPGSLQFDDQTLARDLNNGVGIRTAAGQTDIHVQLSDNTKSFDVNLDHASTATLGDLMKLIRDAAPALTSSDFEVTLDTTNYRLLITDKTGASPAPAVVTALHGSNALADLKINATTGGMGVPAIIAQNIGFPGPNFTTIQELAARTGTQVSSITYEQSTHRLAFTADVSVGHVDADTLALFNTGPLQNLAVTNGPVNLSLTPTGTTKLHLPFEIELTEVGAGFNLGSGTTSTTLVRDLNRGVGVRTVAGNDIHIQLSDNTKSFDVDLDHDPSTTILSSLNLTTATGNDITVTLRDGSTFGLDLDPIGTKTLADLVTALNTAANSALGNTQTKFLAKIDTARGSLILIDRSTGTGSFQVTAPAELGLEAPATKVLDNTLELFAEAPFVTLGALMQKIQQAATTAGLTTTQFEIRIAPDGKGLVLIDGTGGSGSFEVSDLNDSLARRDLGFLTDGSEQLLTENTLLSGLNRGAGVGTVAGNDLRVTLRDGTTFDVDLNSSQTTIGAVLARIQAAADAAFGANQTKFRTGLDPATSKPALFDLTSGSSTFAVSALNSSTARADLGLTANGAPGHTEDGTDARVILLGSKGLFLQGGALHGDTASSHFGIRGGTLASTVNLAASNINASGLWGPVAVSVTGGSASGSLAFNMTFADTGTDAADGMASFRELRRGLGQPDDLITANTQSGTLQLNLPLQVSPVFGGLASTANLSVTAADILDADTPPVLSFTNSNTTTSFLNKVQTLTIDDAIAVLQNTAAYLRSLETQAQAGGQINPLAQMVPGLNRSLGQMLAFGTQFQTLINTLETNPPQTLQGLQSALAGLPGISAVSLGFDNTSGSEALQVNFTFSAAQTSQERFQLILPGTDADLASKKLSSAATILDADKVSPVTVTAAGTMTFGLGVNLTGTHDGFLVGSATSMNFNLRAVQTDLNFEALLGARTVKIVGGSYVFDTDGSGSSTSPASYAVTLSSGRHLFTDAVAATSAALAGKINATLPIKYGPELNQPLLSTINLSIEYPAAAGTVTLTTTGPDVDATLASQPLNGNVQGLRAGFKELFRLLDLAFDAAVFSRGLPLLGTQLMQAADFLEQIRDKVGDNFDLITGILTPQKTRQALFDAFGPGGLNWLQDRNSSNTVNIEDIVITNNPNEVTFALNLHMPTQLLEYPIDVDFGLPGLGLKISALARVMFDFTMPLTFGISTTKGVFLEKSSLDNLSINLDATLPPQPDPSGFQGWLGALPYLITERPGSSTRLLGSFDVTINDPNNDGKLALNEMMSSLGSFARATETAAQTAARGLLLGGFTSSANPDMRFHLVSSLPTGTALPRYQMDLDITGWNISSTVSGTSTTFSNTPPTIAFDHTQFELVSFMRDFVGSALTRLRRAFRPIDGVVDFMNSEVFPFISLIFGRAPYASAGSFGGTVEIGNFAGASLAIRRMVEGGQLVGDPSNPFNAFGVVPPDLMPSAPPLPPDLPSDPLSPEYQTAFLAYLGSPEYQAYLRLLGVGKVTELTGEQWINIGDPTLTDFTIDGTQALQPLPRGMVNLAPQNIHARPFGKASDANGASILGDIRAVAISTTVAAGVQDAALDFLASQFLPGRGAIEGILGGGIRLLLGIGVDEIQLPILKDAGKSFSLLFGDYRLGDANAKAEDTNLLKYGTPELFLYLYQDIPISKEQLAKKVLKAGDILGPLTTFGVRVEAFIPVAFEARADLGLAFDTTGLKSYAATHNHMDIVSGLYFDDQDGVEKNGPLHRKITGGNDDPDEIRILGGAGLGVQIIFEASVLQLKIGVECIVFLGSSWNLHDSDDPTSPNRIRAAEFDVNSRANVYDQSFVIELRADAFVKLSVGISIFRITIIDIRFNIATDTFEIPITGQDDFTKPPALGTLTNGLLTLNFTLGTQANKIFFLGAGDLDGDVIVSTILTDSHGDTYGHHQLFHDVFSVAGQGGAGDDAVFVSSTLRVPVTIHGGAGNDILIGGAGDDLFFGEGGLDFLDGGGGNDTLEGGDNEDTINGGAGNDTIRGGDGIDLLIGSFGDDLIFGGLGANIILGGFGADHLVGDRDDDEIHGGAGRDWIQGGRGRDRLWGDDGADTIEGEDDDDVLHGGLGNDTMDGGAGNDQILGEQNNDTIRGGIGDDRLDGGGASDRVYGDQGPPSPEPSGDDLIISQDGNDFLDGQGGSDTYLIDFYGSGANSLITVLDTGSNVGTDLFTATGTLFADQFLLRANAGGSLSFVAMINSPTAVERINYSGVERIVVNGGLGNDYFAVDDTASEITLNGEGGSDTFQVGQLFASPRTNVEANVSVDDEFATIETTRGFLSNGISKPMTINGGTGDDHFVVFHNRAELALNGDAGDDVFEVRAFALVGSQEPHRARTDISGGAGADLVQYAVNAPVNIDGGDGFDTVVAIGTEFGDDFVITKDGVFGGGLNVSYVNIESLRVDGAEGNDRFFVQSTNEKVATEILGGLGNDTFNMSGDAPPVVSNDLRGHSGIITHDVESLDPLFDGTKIYGVGAHVADNDEPGVVIRPTGGSTIITEGGVADSYQVVLTRMPTVAILVKALAPLPTPDERERRARSFALLSNDPGAVNGPNGTFVTLRFTPDNWFIPQTILVKADATVYSDPAGLLTRPELGDTPNFTFDDSAYEGTRYGVINHLVLADLPSFAGTLAQSQLATVTGATEAVIEVTGTASQNEVFNIAINGGAPISFTAGASASHADILDGLKAAFDTAKSQAPTGPLKDITALRMIQKKVTLSGTVDAGDQFTATFGDKTFTYTVPDTGVSTLAQVAAGFAQLINAANLTGVTADARANDGTLLVRAPAATTFSVANPTDPGNNSAIGIFSVIDLLVLSAEDGDLATDNSTNFTVSDNSAGASLAIDVDGAAGATTQFASAKDLSSALIGRKIEITSGPGAGQQRFIVAINGSVLTVDRPWNIDDTPTFQSTYLVRIDDAIVGKPTAVNNSSFTFTDSAHATPFPTAGEGLRGRVLRIVGGPGAGQERLILSNTATTLTLNGAWRVPPTSASLYRIDLYDGLAVPGVRVQVNDNDQPGIIVDETKGYNSGLVDDTDTITAVIEASNGDHLGEQDVVQVRLTANPGATPVEVSLNYDGAQLSLTQLNGAAIANDKLIFNSSNWNTYQTVRVAAANDTIREAFHASLIRFNITAGSSDATLSQTDSFTIPGDRPVFFLGLTHAPSGSVTVTRNGNAVPLLTSGSVGLAYDLVGSQVIFYQDNQPTKVSGSISVAYSYVQDGFLGALTPSVLVHISDDDAPTVLVRESGGSTDVMEAGALSNVHLEKLTLGWFTGSISTSGERDRYTVFLVGGQSYALNLGGAATSDGTLSDPYLRVYNSLNPSTVIAFDDDAGDGNNSRLAFTPSTSGYYILEAGGFNDTATGTYTLSVLPGSATGSIAVNAERDRYGLNLVAGTTYTFEMRGSPTGEGTLTDPYLRLYNSTSPSTVIASDDDSGEGYNSLLTYTPSASGLYFLEGAGYADARTGTYTISWTDKSPALSAAAVQDIQGANDDYTIVLTKSPAMGKTVSVTVTPEITKTTRTGGIRHDAVQVALSSTDSRVTANGDGTLTVTFSDQNWDNPVAILVKAIDDAFVDGGDTKVFPPGPHTLSGILGPVTIDGGGGQGSLVGIPAPLKLAGETNVKQKSGDVVAVVGSQATVLTSDLQAVLGSADYTQLLGKTLQVTAVTPASNTTHSAIGQFRQIVQVTVNMNGTTTLTLNQAFELNLAGHTGEQDSDIKSYAITNESLNFFVNEASQVDVMFVHDEDSPADSSGILTANRLTGLNMGPDVTIGGQKYMPGGITYGNLEVLDIQLGTGFNNFTVLGTPTRSDGYQTWTILKTGDDLADPNHPTARVGDTVTVKLNATPVVSAERSVTSATDASATAFATLVDSAFTFATADGGLQGQTVTITGGTGAGQTRRVLLNYAHTLVLDRKWDVVPDSTSTYQLTKAADGHFAVNTQGGNDLVDASASTLGIVAFGGLGQDTLTGGSGDDILFGDRGRVDYFNQAGAIVTRLGDAPPPITGFVTTAVTNSTLTTLTDSAASFPVPDDVVAGLGNNDIGLRGLYVAINNGTGFLQASQLITDNTLNTLTLAPGFDVAKDLPGPGGANPSQYRISTYPEDQTDGVVRDPGLLITVDDNLGDMDTLNAGAGNDQIFGGAGADTITGGADDDILVGDAGRLDRSRDPAATVDVFTPGLQAPQVQTIHSWLRTKSFASGGADTIQGDGGNDLILGGFGGDTITAGEGHNLVLGDDGQVDYTRTARSSGAAGADLDATDIDLVESLSTSAYGGADNITTGDGDDLVIGGRGADTLHVGAGNNLVIGDSGRVTAASASSPHLLGNAPITLGLVESIQFDDGGIDDITTGTGNDIVLGGFGGDTIDVSSGHNIVLGDDGLIDYSRADRNASAAGADTDASDIDLIESLSTSAYGGADMITAGEGDDLVIGGRGADTLHVSDGNNLVIGDSGRVTGSSASSPHLLGNAPITLGLVESIQFDDGGIDDITSGTGNDIVLGGFGGDTINVSSGHNIVLGDDGQVDYSRADRNASAAGADTDASDIDLIESLSASAYGGADDITTGGGDDLVIGGRGADTLHVGGGNNLVIGDSGRVTAASASSPHLLGNAPITLGLIESIQFDDGGIDDITTGTGNDIVLGGFGGDTIDVSSGHNIVLGDDGQIDYSRADRNASAAGADTDASDIDLIESLSTSANGGADNITAGDGDDLVIGGRGADTLHVGAGNNLVIGDSGRVTGSSASSPHLLGNAPITLGLVESIQFDDGGIDDIITGTGNDIVLGGFGGDTIVVSSGHNIVLGDDGQIDYSRADRSPSAAGADTDASDIDLIESLSTSAYGGADNITTGSGDDLVIGGRFGDIINVGDGNNLVIGDSGRVTGSSANSPHLLGNAPITLGLVETIQHGDGGADQITTGTGNDIVLGGFDGDLITLGAGNDIGIGDNAQIDYTRADRAPAAPGADTDAAEIDLVESLARDLGGADTLFGNAGNDILVGGFGADKIYGGNGSTNTPVTGADVDILVGDNVEMIDVVSMSPQRVNRIRTSDTLTTTGGDDLIEGNEDDDVILGGVGSDIIDGHTGRDLILGDNGTLQSRTVGLVTDPRIRVVVGTKLYDGAGQVLIDPTQQFADPNGVTAWANWVITLDDGATGLFGNDYIAGGPQNDTIFGQRGEDVIQGDGSITGKLLTTPSPVGAARLGDGTLAVAPSVEAATDGDDYIEGGDGSDVVFGNLGQDDIIGGNSSLFGLGVTAQRGDGADLLFGGAGTDLARYDLGDTSTTGHARDADTLVGDNGNVYRIVGTGGIATVGFLTFTYDSYSPGTGSTNKIIPRAVELIDYTPGGPSFRTAAATEPGAGDEIHGESGDDFIYGMKGNDVLFGEGQDDDLIGGWGNDWIAGGIGDDGILGDDGRVMTSRNGLAESLFGITAIPASQLDVVVTTSSRQNQATINISGQLKKSADLEPFGFGGNDIIFGGLGNDSLHGGAGDDAVSGAEALPAFYTLPVNPGNILGFGSVRAGEFANYNYFDARAKIANFILNFEASINGQKLNDGQDVVFGDDGNDWLVGGTMADHLFGGTGNDLLNADDNLETGGGSNNGNELGEYGDADIAFGGGGKDVLIANNTLDRLIDWGANYNTFVVPFNNVTAPTVTTAQEASLYQYLYAVSGSDGADPTRVGTGLGLAARNGEPFGELGLFIPSDPGYQAQTGLVGTPSGPAAPPALPAPSALTPNGTIATETPTFTWTSVAGASWYDVLVVDSTLGVLVLRNADATGTSWTTPSGQSLTPGHLYTWYVGGVSIMGDTTTYSAGQTFFITPLAAPAPSGPTGSITGETPTFTWSGVAAAHHYYLYVFDNTSQTVAINNPNISGTSFTPSAAQALTPGHSYTWYVSAITTNGLGYTMSPGTNFIIAALAGPTLTGPSGLIAASAGYDTPTFTWSSVPGAHHYYLYVYDNTSKMVALTNPNVSGTSFTPASSQALTPGHSYTWYAIATSTNGQGYTLSAGMSFTLAALAGPTLTGPNGFMAAASGFDAPTFTWSGVAGAHHYYLYVFDNTSQTVAINNPNVSGTSFTPGAAQALTPGHSFTWYASAISANGQVYAISAGMNFTLAGLTKPILVSPGTVVSPGSVIATDVPTFTWNAVAGAARYDVLVVDNTTGLLVYRNTSAAGTSASLPSGQTLANGHSFIWYVGAVSTNGLLAVYSVGMNFSVVKAAASEEGAILKDQILEEIEVTDGQPLLPPPLDSLGLAPVTALDSVTKQAIDALFAQEDDGELWNGPAQGLLACEATRPAAEVDVLLAALVGLGGIPLVRELDSRERKQERTRPARLV